MDFSHILKQKIFKVIKSSSNNISQKSYLIGGYVRDYILGKNLSIIDIDILTVGKGILLAKKVAKNIKKYYTVNSSIIVFKRYGTAMLKYNDKKIEFVGSRKESYKDINSRNPIIKIGTLKDDQYRRDFTINTLAISLNKNDYGKLIDPFNGFLDIKNKIIKTPLNANITYSDDPLRMMRAIRFASQLQFKIETTSFDAIKKNKNRIDIVSKERIVEEFNKILLSKKPSIGLNLMYKSGLLDIILPEVTILKKTEIKHGFKYKDNFVHTLQVVDNISINNENSIWLKWAALLHDIGKPYSKKFSIEKGWSFHDHEVIGSNMVINIFNRLKLPKGNILKYVQKIIKYSCRPVFLISGTKISDSAIRRLLFDIGTDLEDLIKLCLADITTNNYIKAKKYRDNIICLLRKINNFKEKDRIINFNLPISGYDIMNTFYINPCNKIGLIKNYIKNAILDGKIKNNFNSAYILMLKKGKELGLQKKS